MNLYEKFSAIRHVATATLMLFTLSACLMSEEESDVERGIVAESRVSGSVGDGPVVNANMRAIGADGLEIMTFSGSTIASYDVTISTAPQNYPVRIEASGGTDLVTNLPPDFLLEGVVAAPSSQTVANVNPFSTVAVRLASEMSGGLTPSNISAAEMIVVNALGSGLDTLQGSGPISTLVNERNIAELVRASEALAETIRRTRDLLNGVGFSVSGDAVVDAIASDVVDGFVDGLGGPSSDARIAAVTTLVYAQVLMESMANQLRVNGADATAAMQQAIERVSVRAPTTNIADLSVTSQMVSRARVGLAAAFVISGDDNIRNTHTAVSGLQEGMDSDLVRTLLPGGYRLVMQSVLTSIAGADASTINMVNQIARSSGDIDPGNSAPAISGAPPTSVEVGSAYQFSPTASDADGDALTFSIVNRPSWASFNASTGTLSGTPGVGDVGSYQNISISVSDGELSASLSPFTINVTNGNAAPQISGAPDSFVVVGNTYAFTPVASDLDGDSLSFSISNAPVWASFDTATGTLSGAPQSAHVANYTNIMISVSDGQFTSTLPAFSIQVINANTPPTISGSPATSVQVGELYSFTPSANDPDMGDTLTFSIANRPSWASFNTKSGRLTGTPGQADVGTFAGIRISVFDGQQTDSLPAFDIEVRDVPNSAPTISGSPPSQVNANSFYDFRPDASDPDNGDTLTFSITGLPAWASFDSANGRLSGTPGVADVGVYNDITISVSDGTALASLGPFSITVQAVSLGSVTLSWTAPTQNEDGSALADLAGYRIYWGTSPGSYTDSVTINNPGVTTYVIENLAPATYEFVATAFNTDGVESAFSSPTTTTLP